MPISQPPAHSPAVDEVVIADEVIVTAPRLPALRGEAVFAAVQLDPQTLRSAPRLDLALRQVPGVSLFRRTGSDAANPTIQGISLRAIGASGAGRALVTLDGAPQNDPFGGWVIWSSLPPEVLSGATLVRGAGAGPYGAGALTGTVAFRELSANQGQSRVNIAAGSQGEGRLAGVFTAPGLVLNTQVETNRGYTPVRGPLRGTADAPTNFDTISAGGRVQGLVGPVWAAIRLSGYQERRGAGLVGARSAASGGAAALSLREGDDRGGWQFQAWARSSDLANSAVAVAPGRKLTTPASDQFATPALGYGLNAAWQRRGDIWSWEAGVDARVAEGKAQERFRYLNGAFTRGRESGGRTAVAGLYLDTTREAGDLLLTGGLRVDGWSQSDSVRRERDLATGVLTLNSSSPDKSGVTPTARFGARWRLSDQTWVRAATYAGFRTPTLNELHRPFRIGNDVTEANPGLTPEKLYGFELGAGGDGALSWKGTLFFNRLDDPITNVTLGLGPKTFPIAGFIPAGGALRQRQNVGRIDAWGLEAEVARTIGSLELNAALSATHARVDGGATAAQLAGKRPAQTPELTITTGARWRASERLTLSTDARYESARFEDDLNTRSLAPSASLDARASWRVGSMEIYLAAENLTNAKTVVGQTADGAKSLAAPVSVRLGLSLQLE